LDVDDLHRLLTAERANTEIAVRILRTGELLIRTVIPQLDG
jgi:hypothetical protein